MKTSTKTLSATLRILALEIQSEDGIANAAIAEAAERLEEQEQEAELVDLRSEIEQSDALEIAELLSHVVEVAVSMSQELQELHDAGVEAGCEMASTKALLDEWNTLYQAAHIYE